MRKPNSTDQKFVTMSVSRKMKLAVIAEAKRISGVDMSANLALETVLIENMRLREKLIGLTVPGVQAP